MNRKQMLKNLVAMKDQIWDVVVIGGGATGLGSALEAATRGYNTLLLEQIDFAKGTSSRSTKLVHGGVRYLAQGDIALVLEALHERGLLKQNAPHLVHNQEFIIPNYEWWGGPFYTIGLKVYDMMAGRLGLGPSVHISKKKTLEAIPNLNPEGLKGGVIYYDGQFDDARLAINLAQSLVENGGTALNYAQVIQLTKSDDGLINGLMLQDVESRQQHQVRAKVVVNATGVFVDAILKMDDPQAVPLVRPSQGVHVVLDKSFLQGDAAIMIPKTDDGRVLFVVPWHNKVVVGTTDTPLETASLEPRALEEEIDFILNTASRYLTKAPQRKDVKSIFAGLRPLAAPQGEGTSTKEISRNHKLMVSLSGLVTITGGKWTTYRKMGEDTIDKAALVAGLEERKCVTKNMPIHGYVAHQAEGDHLQVYGADKPALLRLLAEKKEWEEILHPDLPYLKGQVIWAVRQEMARTVEDVLSRRLRALLLDAKASIEITPLVARLMAEELGFDKTWEMEQIAEYTALAEGYILK